MEIPHELQGSLILAGFGLLLAWLERAKKHVEDSEPVQRASLRDRAATDGEEEVRRAIERTDATWAIRWDKREEQIAHEAAEKADRERTLLATVNELLSINARNADVHEQTVVRFGDQLTNAQNALGLQREELAGMKTQIARLEAELKTRQESFDSLHFQYENERRQWHRTMDHERLLREDMTRRAAAAGVPFTATDVLGNQR